MHRCPQILDWEGGGGGGHPSAIAVPTAMFVKYYAHSDQLVSSPTTSPKEEEFGHNFGLC